MLTGHKDTDLRVLLEMDNREFLIFCGKKDSLQFENKYINKLCNIETLWRDRLFKYYGNFYPEPKQSWKNLYLSLIYHLDKYEYKKDQESFFKASENGHLDVIKYLISLRTVDPAADDNEALILASYKGHLNVVKYLIGLSKEYKIDPAAQDNRALRRASSAGRLNVVKYLTKLPKKYNIDPSAGDNAAMESAKFNKHTDVVRYLMGLSQVNDSYSVFL